MPWTTQEPEATDVLLTGIKVHGRRSDDATVHLEIDKLQDGFGSVMYRLTMGNLFWCREVARDISLEALVREARRVSRQGEG